MIFYWSSLLSGRCVWAICGHSLAENNLPLVLLALANFWQLKSREISLVSKETFTSGFYFYLQFFGFQSSSQQWLEPKPQTPACWKGGTQKSKEKYTSASLLDLYCLQPQSSLSLSLDPGEITSKYCKQLLCVPSIPFFPLLPFTVSQSAEVLGEAGKRRVPDFQGHTECQHMATVTTRKNYTWCPWLGRISGFVTIWGIHGSCKREKRLRVFFK